MKSSMFAPFFNSVISPIRVAKFQMDLASDAFFARFKRDKEGVAAVEFALIFPAAIALYLGCVDISQILSASRKAANVSSAVGDLVAQAVQIDDAGMDNIFLAAKAMIEPFPKSELKVVISSVKADSKGKVTVDWSDAMNASARGKGSSVTLPEGLLEPDSSLILSEVNYKYQSPVTHLVSGNGINTDDVFYLKPRRSLFVARVD